MHRAARPPLARFMAIDRAVRDGTWPNASSLALQLEVAPRTIRRDITFMRDRLDAPLEFDPTRNGYRYTEPSYRLSYFRLTEGELVALFLAEQVLRQYRGTPYGPDLERAFAKITAGLDDPIAVDAQLLSATLSFRLTAPTVFDLGIIRDLIAATAHRRRLVMEYWSASRDERSRREVDPYHLASIDGQWYLIGYCHLRREILEFVPSRILALEVTGATFDVPASFRVEEYLGRSFAVFRGDRGAEFRVRLRFRGEAVRYIRERQWHPSQTLEPTPDGDLIMTLTLGHLREVERWALSWTPFCQVIEPDELRQRVAEALARGHALNSGHHPPTAEGAPRRTPAGRRDPDKPSE